MDSSTILGLVGFGVSVAGTIYAAINHKRVRSKCCGRVLEASLDVDSTTPTKSAPV
jgi:hypothetical protein